MESFIFFCHFLHVKAFYYPTFGVLLYFIILILIGSSWSSAISTAKWKGALLRDLLIAAGVTEEQVYAPNSPLKHVHFIGADSMQASIPMRKAFSREGDVLIAYEMNDRPIPPQHG